MHQEGEQSGGTNLKWFLSTANAFISLVELLFQLLSVILSRIFTLLLTHLRRSLSHFKMTIENITCGWIKKSTQRPSIPILISFSSVSECEVSSLFKDNLWNIKPLQFTPLEALPGTSLSMVWSYLLVTATQSFITLSFWSLSSFPSVITDHWVAISTGMSHLTPWFSVPQLQLHWLDPPPFSHSLSWSWPCLCHYVWNLNWKHPTFRPSPVFAANLLLGFPCLLLCFSSPIRHLATYSLL